MTRTDTCDACGRENVSCEVETLLTGHGPSVFVNCVDFDACFTSWED